MTETSAQPYAGALEALHRILNREPEPDEVLRQTVAVVHDRIERYRFVGILFVEEGELVLGPWKGDRGDGDAGALEVPIAYKGRTVGALRVAGWDLDEGDRAFLERVALLVSAHCLVGWDTGGVPWSEMS
jgi:putative methionine-R-sulfoxide reductase with GAF domain